MRIQTRGLMLDQQALFPTISPGPVLEALQQSKTHSYSPRGIKVWNFQRNKTPACLWKPYFRLLWEPCVTWNLLPMLTSIGSYFYYPVKDVPNSEEESLSQPSKTIITSRGTAVPAKVSKSQNRDEYVSEEETKELRFCWNPEGEIFLTAYVPSSQCKHSMCYKSLTKPLRFDFYLSNYCQHILYISFKRLNPIFQFIKLFPTFTEFYIKSETYLN